MSFNSKKIGLVLTLLLASLCASTASARCNKVNFDNYRVPFNFGSSLFIDPATPVGTIVAQQSISSDVLYGPFGGWIGVCDSGSSINYWWLEQHYSASANDNPAVGVTSQAPGGEMYVIQDNGSGNPYDNGRRGSGSLGYTVEILTDGAAYPFRLNKLLIPSPSVNLPALSKPVTGISCAAAKSQGFTGRCGDNQTVVNWRDLGPFTLQVTLYRLAGIIPANGLTTNQRDNAISRFSVMDNTSTPPRTNTNMFPLVYITLSGNINLQTAPCEAFSYPNVNLGSIKLSAFSNVGMGQPPRNIPAAPVNVSARCSANTAVKWAVMGTHDSYDSDGSRGILALDTSANSASGVGVQLTSTEGTPLPITPANSTNYKWIDNNLTANSNGVLLIQFLARYVTVGKVVPGIANSHAYIVVAPK